MPRSYAVGLVLLSAAAFGSMAIFAKAAFAAGVSPAMLLALRFVIAVVILAPLVWIKRARLPRGRMLAGFALMGGLYTVQAQCYFTALVHASSGLVALLLYVYPALVTILAVLLGWERLDKRTFFLLAAAVAGMTVMLGDNLEGQPLGIVLALGAAGVYAVYILIGGRLTIGADPLAATLVVMATGALGNGAIAVADGSHLPPNAAAWLAIGAIGILTVTAIASFLVGIKYIGATQTSIISTLEPVVTLCLGIMLLGESVTAGQLAGGATVLVAVILLAQRPRQPVPSQAAA